MHWLFLFAAIASEIIGVLAMKTTASDFPLLSYSVMFVAIALSFYFLALAVKVIPLAVAYATWEGLGLVMVAGLGALLFDEAITPLKIVGFCAVFAGVLLMEKGIDDAPEKPAAAEKTA